MKQERWLLVALYTEPKSAKAGRANSEEGGTMASLRAESEESAHGLVVVQ